MSYRLIGTGYIYLSTTGYKYYIIILCKISFVINLSSTIWIIN